MAYSDILTMIYDGDTKATTEYALRLLTRGFDEPLKRWGRSIAYAYMDPAKELLNKLVYEDRTNILLNIHRSFEECEGHPAFDDQEDVFMMGGDGMNSYDIASFIDSVNEKYDDEGVPVGTKSSALSLWARWLRNEREVEDKLMYAIAMRFWRNSGDYEKDIIRGIALYMHAHLFYNMGWNPATNACDLTSVKTDHNRYMVGKEIELTPLDTFRSDSHSQEGGSLVFNCIPRVHNMTWKKEGMEVEETRKLYITKKNVMEIMSFGEDGIAIRGTYNNEPTGYFLMYPCEYERGAQLVWDNSFV